MAQFAPCRLLGATTITVHRALAIFLDSMKSPGEIRSSETRLDARARPD
jgi:hypothetical protein